MLFYRRFPHGYRNHPHPLGHGAVRPVGEKSTASHQCAGYCPGERTDPTGILPVLSVIVYAAFFMMSWGPICWVLISEIFPNTIRGKAVAIAVAFQWIFNYIVSSTFPALYDFSPMFAYSLYGIICVAAAIFVWRWVPETKGKTLEDMSKLWKKNK